MAQIFHPGMNILAKVTIFGAVFIAAGVTVAGASFVRSSYVTQVNAVRDQPVPFSHQHHVRELGLDCRYCHHNVEKSASAGIPATEVCMGCHSQVWKTAEVLEPVRESFRSGKSLEWTRVHDLPDFVYFNHKIHIAKGVACETCHGRVDEMPLMRRGASLYMDWCLKCHRHPELAVRPQSELFEFGSTQTRIGGVSKEPIIRATSGASAEILDKYVAQLNQPGSGQPGSAKQTSVDTETFGRELVAQYGIVTRQLTDCVVCHR